MKKAIAAAAACLEAERRAFVSRRPFLAIPAGKHDTTSFCSSIWYEQWGPAIVRLGAWAAINANNGVSVRAAEPVLVRFSSASHVDEAHDNVQARSAFGFEHGLKLFSESTPGVAASHPLLPWRQENSRIDATLTKTPTPLPTASISRILPSPVPAPSDPTISPVMPQGEHLLAVRYIDHVQIGYYTLHLPVF